MHKYERAGRAKSQTTAEPTDRFAPGVHGPGNAAQLEQLAHKASQPLPDRPHFERTLGVDLTDLRVMMGGPEIEDALAAAGANAVSLHDSLLFAEADPSPDMIGHELIHWVQKNNKLPAGMGGSTRSPETEADELGSRLARDESVQVQGTANPSQAQFDLRDTVQDQRDSRGVDTPESPGGNQRLTFIDHDDEAPTLQQDHGFLDDGNGNIDESRREDPTWSDQLERLEWIAKLEAAEVLRPDLVDATSAYRHFLEGGGATRVIDYERYIAGDSSGATTLASLVEDAQQAAMERHDAMIQGRDPEPGSTSFRMRTDAIPVGNDGRYPYPATENWQKAIGAHQMWLEMDVTVEIYELSRAQPPGVTPDHPPICTPGGDTVVTYGRRFTVELTGHMEDMYNFNPGSADIATGTPDAANGRFELTGLGHEYLNTATFTRQFCFEASMDPAPVAGSGGLPSPDSGRPPRTDGRPAGARRSNPVLR